jgi:hypothetical protein
MNYVKTLLTRKNTITGVMYSEDPTVFAWELANEPETSADYEINLGIKPGSLVYNWLEEMSAFVKGLAPNHMVSPTQAACCCSCRACHGLKQYAGHMSCWGWDAHISGPALGVFKAHLSHISPAYCKHA